MGLNNYSWCFEGKLTEIMRIVLAQTNIVWEEKKRNIEKAKKIISAHNGTDVILFPEMSFTGFSMNTALTGESNCETVDIMCKIAQENQVSIGFGWVEKNLTGCRNIYTIIDNTGNIISSYAKIHPFSYSDEDKYFVGGENIERFELNGIPFTSFICYDLRFPELFRSVAETVHAVILPANWPAKRSEHWKTLLRARAIENQVYIFAINCVNNVGGQYYSGDSCVINPNGDVIEMLSDQEGVITYDFLDNVEEYREQFPVLRDKKQKFM